MIHRQPVCCLGVLALAPTNKSWRRTLASERQLAGNWRNGAEQLLKWHAVIHIGGDGTGHQMGEMAVGDDIVLGVRFAANRRNGVDQFAPPPPPHTAPSETLSTTAHDQSTRWMRRSFTSMGSWMACITKRGLLCTLGSDFGGVHRMYSVN